MVVCPVYEDPADQATSPFDFQNASPFPWSWLSTINRVNSQVQKVRLLLCLDIHRRQSFLPDSHSYVRDYSCAITALAGCACVPSLLHPLFRKGGNITQVHPSANERLMTNETIHEEHNHGRPKIWLFQDTNYYTVHNLHHHYPPYRPIKMGPLQQ